MTFRRFISQATEPVVTLGEYDRDLVLAHASQVKCDSSVERLEIIDKFDAGRGVAQSSPRRWEL